jgi:hypothetical protein
VTTSRCTFPLPALPNVLLSFALSKCTVTFELRNNSQVTLLGHFLFGILKFQNFKLQNSFQPYFTPSCNYKHIPLHHIMAAIICLGVSYPLLAFLTSTVSNVAEIFSLNTVCSLLNIHYIFKNIHNTPHQQNGYIYIYICICMYMLRTKFETCFVFSCWKSSQLTFRLISRTHSIDRYHIDRCYQSVPARYQ